MPLCAIKGNIEVEIYIEKYEQETYIQYILNPIG